MKNILELLKKNIAIVICLIVVIAAIVADFIPLGGFRDELRSQAEARKENLGAIDSLLTKQRTLPNLNPGAAEAAPLPVEFPTQAIIDSGKKVSDEFLAAARNLTAAASALNKKEPLFAGALPEGDFPAMEEFKRRYRRVTDMTLPGRTASLPVTAMNAGFAITQEDLNREEERVKKEVFEQMAQYSGEQVINQPEVEAAIQFELSRLQETLVKRSAQTCKVYINPATMQVDQNIILSTGRLDPVEVFWAQVKLWTQEDLFRAIADVNSGAANVTESPIKYLMALQVSPTFIGMTPASTDPNAPPSAPSADPNAALTPNYRLSPTGRTSNGVYDVMHIEASIIVDAEKLPVILNQLGRGRMVTVALVRQVIPEDPAKFANAGYFYGEKPVVKVDMLLEVLLFRDWTMQYMPDSIKRTLGIPLAGADPAAEPPPG